MSLNARDKKDQAETRRLLLDAAGEVFAEAGFRNATVRDICRRAGANIAAVNYHFGDKEALYLAVMRDSYRVALEKFPPDLDLPGSPTTGQRLRAFIRSFLLRMLSPGPHARFGKLIAREMIEPTAALDSFVNQENRPVSSALMSIVRGMLGRRANEALVRRCAMSVVSQVLFYHNCRPVISRMFPEMKFGPAEIEVLADHITRFSTAAIRQLAKSRKTAG